MYKEMKWELSKEQNLEQGISLCLDLCNENNWLYIDSRLDLDGNIILIYWTEVD
jgi:hypothetical protein